MLEWEKKLKQLIKSSLDYYLMEPVELSPKPLAMNPITFPLCSGNQEVGRVMVTRVRMANDAELIIP